MTGSGLMGSRPMGPGATYVGAECSPGGTATLSATTEQSCHPISAGGTAIWKVHWEGNHS